MIFNINVGLRGIQYIYIWYCMILKITCLVELLKMRQKTRNYQDANATPS